MYLLLACLLFVHHMDSEGAGTERFEMLPLISVIIPAYKAEKFIDATLKSVAGQTFTAFECLVVDDGSPDGTVEKVRAFVETDSRFKLYCQQNAGPLVARNYGYGFTSKDTIAVLFLDADDTLEPDALAVLYTALQANPNAPAVHGNARFIDANGSLIRHHELEEGTRARIYFDGKRVTESYTGMPTTFAHIALCCVIMTPGMVLFRKRAFEDVGMWDSKIYISGDWELYVRLTRNGDIPFVDHVVLNYRKHGASLSGRRNMKAISIQKVRIRAIYSPQNTRQQTQVAVGAYRQFYQIMAAGRCKHAAEHLRAGQYRGAASQSKLMLLNLSMYLIGGTCATVYGAAARLIPSTRRVTYAVRP
jgi:glycosyltransferase involved in cell wall biosynthesis